MKDHTTSVGRLYIVPTPIGNLEDMTHRAVRVLGEVARILAEDTRRTRILLDRYAVTTPVVHFDDHNARRLIPGLVAEMVAGLRVALVSDAGTPGISDPGTPLIRAVAGIVPVEALPGASAATTALSASGFPLDRFVFEGFLPRRGAERKRRLEALVAEERTVAFFESPQRLAATLGELEAVGVGARPAMVARELSKLFETLHRGTVAELAALFHAEPPRGEIVVVLDRIEHAPPSPERIRELLDQALAAGMGVREASRRLAPGSGLSASELYRMALERRGEGESG